MRNVLSYKKLVKVHLYYIIYNELVVKSERFPYNEIKHVCLMTGFYSRYDDW